MSDKMDELISRKSTTRWIIEDEFCTDDAMAQLTFERSGLRSVTFQDR